MPSTRRQWALETFGLTAMTAELDAAWQHAHDAAAAGTKLEYLTAEDARDVEALTAEIIPTTDTPGAREAGVVYFIDRALATWDSAKRPSYREGFDAFRAKAIPPRDYIASIEGTPFFEILRTHTALGFLGSPIHGGNRGKAGWAHIGFEDSMIYTPPFGYYDAPENGQ